MDFRVDRNRTQVCGSYNNVEESEYAVVDDQEEVFNVHIHPARPIHDEREYADRDLPRSLSGQRLSLVSTVSIHPACLPREIPQTTGPAVNRDLKPGKQKTKLSKKLPPVPPEEQPSHRHSTSPFILELTNHIAEVALHEPYKKEQLRKTEKGNFDSHIKGPHNTQNASAHLTNQRHSLDLETHDLDKRSHQSLERVPSRRHHHEWPQTREDIDQHDFVPMEKPQTYCEEDWYVGACKRTDAEHALHLVNKDGAFLVRDCSSCTDSEPLVLVVYHEKKVYNVKIRFIESTSKYALGTGQRSNDMFDSVADIVKFHSIFPIIFISGRSMPGKLFPENCVLTCPITKMDVNRLLK
ncbi:cytokine-dependent hematopoietic cell linker isoform X2 [Melanotaenia boesemani]|uniref:cytokine-dependent hematopoietic cell linker isoform X2 n=1 Tax=Melanotaenia boesemani TaxID=1250792 RepID=UPI001C045DCD|nr:cytokine-dependent hematopoietic cell linker isoform X2 [Melanotaenia boesemani]